MLGNRDIIARALFLRQYAIHPSLLVGSRRVQGRERLGEFPEPDVLADAVIDEEPLQGIGPSRPKSSMTWGASVEGRGSGTDRPELVAVSTSWLFASSPSRRPPCRGGSRSWLSASSGRVGGDSQAWLPQQVDGPLAYRQQPGRLSLDLHDRPQLFQVRTEALGDLSCRVELEDEPALRRAFSGLLVLLSSSTTSCPSGSSLLSPSVLSVHSHIAVNACVGLQSAGIGVLEDHREGLL